MIAYSKYNSGYSVIKRHGDVISAAPTGVTMRHRNVLINGKRVLAQYFSEPRTCSILRWCDQRYADG